MESLLPVSAADEISNRGLGLRHKSSGLLTLVVHSRPLRMWEASAGDQVLKMLPQLSRHVAARYRQTSPTFKRQSYGRRLPSQSWAGRLVYAAGADHL